jgi:hypothetical protein
LRVRTALLVASFVIAYFLGPTYAILRAGIGFGVVEIFRIPYARRGCPWNPRCKVQKEVRAAFLIFLNVSRIFFLGIGATYLLNSFGIVKIPLSYVNFFGSWILPFGVYAVLNFVHVFGFGDRKQKYIFFSWVRDSSSSEIHRF